MGDCHEDVCLEHVERDRLMVATEINIRYDLEYLHECADGSSNQIRLLSQRIEALEKGLLRDRNSHTPGTRQTKNPARQKGT